MAEAQALSQEHKTQAAKGVAEKLDLSRNPWNFKDVKHAGLSTWCNVLSEISLAKQTQSCVLY